MRLYATMLECTWQQDKHTVPSLSQHVLPESNMNFTLGITPLISLIAGILILAVPRMLNYIVAIYLITIGLLGLFGGGNFHIS